jgi:hypothetical protein
LTLYAGFAVLIGFVFWTGVSAIVHREFIVIIGAALLAAGIAWALYDPGFPAAIFTAVIVFLFGALHLLTLMFLDSTDDRSRVVRSAAVGLAVLGVGLTYTLLGVGERLFQKPNRMKRRKRKALREDEP